METERLELGAGHTCGRPNPSTGHSRGTWAGGRSLRGLSGRRPGDPQTGQAPRSGKMEDSLLTRQAGGRGTAPRCGQRHEGGRGQQTGAASGGSALPSGSAGPRRELAGRPRPRGERDAGPTPSVQPLRARRPWGRPATGGAPGNGKRGMAAGLLGGLLHRQTGDRAPGGPAASADGWGVSQ